MELTATLLASTPPIGSTVRSVTIKVNNRCHLRCRHCSIGYSRDYAGDDRRISAADLEEITAAIDPLVYDMVLLAGGEPSLNR